MGLTAAFVDEALRRNEVRELQQVLASFRAVGLDLAEWRDSFDAVLRLIEAPPDGVAGDEALRIRSLALACLRDLSMHLPPGADEMHRLAAVLGTLQNEIHRDRFSKDCHRALWALKLDRRLPPAEWEHTLITLIEFFVDPQSGDAGDPHLNLATTSARIKDLFVSAYSAGGHTKGIRERMRPYLQWLASQPDYFLLHTLWRIYEGSDHGPDYVWTRWHHEQVQIGWISPGFGPSQIELAIEINKEGKRIFFWPEGRWRGWEWPRDIQQYQTLLDDVSPVVRAAAAYTIGSCYLGACKVKGSTAAPTVREMFLLVQDEERRGTGVAGAFLQGAMFGIDELLTSDSSLDLREWMFQTLAIGPEPEFTVFQQLAFHAHEYLEPTEENLRRLIAINREDAALLLATEEVNHDPAAEEVFRKRFRKWRLEGANRS